MCFVVQIAKIVWRVPPSRERRGHDLHDCSGPSCLRPGTQLTQTTTLVTTYFLNALKPTQQLPEEREREGRFEFRAVCRGELPPLTHRLSHHRRSTSHFLLILTSCLVTRARSNTPFERTDPVSPHRIPPLSICSLSSYLDGQSNVNLSIPPLPAPLPTTASSVTEIRWQLLRCRHRRGHRPNFLLTSSLRKRQVLW